MRHEIPTDVVDEIISLEILEETLRYFGGESLAESERLVEIVWDPLQPTFKTVSYRCVTAPPTLRVFYRYDNFVS